MKTWLFVLIVCLLPGMTEAFCTLGEDGNRYTDENPFVDAENHDFRLKPGSCPVDRGVTRPGVTVDFDGTRRPQGKAPDIGAYELRQIEAPSDLTVEEGD